MKDIYVYLHVNPNRQEVFYVGIGNNKRPYLKSNRSSQWKRYTKKHDYQVIIIHEKLSWEEACLLEIKYIAQIGRRDKGLGNLVNQTDGGDGTRNVVISEATRNKLRYKKSDDHKLKLSQSMNNRNSDDKELTSKLISSKLKGNNKLKWSSERRESAPKHLSIDHINKLKKPRGAQKNPRPSINRFNLTEEEIELKNRLRREKKFIRKNS